MEAGNVRQKAHLLSGFSHRGKAIILGCHLLAHLEQGCVAWHCSEMKDSNRQSTVTKNYYFSLWELLFRYLVLASTRNTDVNTYEGEIKFVHAFVIFQLPSVTFDCNYVSFTPFVSPFSLLVSFCYCLRSFTQFVLSLKHSSSFDVCFHLFCMRTSTFGHTWSPRGSVNGRRPLHILFPRRCAFAVNNHSSTFTISWVWVMKLSDIVDNEPNFNIILFFYSCWRYHRDMYSYFSVSATFLVVGTLCFIHFLFVFLFLFLSFFFFLSCRSSWRRMLRELLHRPVQPRAPANPKGGRTSKGNKPM